MPHHNIEECSITAARLLNKLSATSDTLARQLFVEEALQDYAALGIKPPADDPAQRPLDLPPLDTEANYPYTCPRCGRGVRVLIPDKDGRRVCYDCKR